MEMEMLHLRGLSFANQRKVVIYRDVKKMSWDDIAACVVNKMGEPSTRDCVKRVYDKFQPRKGRCSYGYGRCGRRRWKLTKDIQNWLVRRLLRDRKKMICTSTSLQRDLAGERGVVVCASAIRKVLVERGFKWLPRAQKRG